MTATITPYRPPQQAGRDGFAQLLHAEWTKFRTLRGWVITIVVAAVLIDVLGLLLPLGQHDLRRAQRRRVPAARSDRPGRRGGQRQLLPGGPAAGRRREHHRPGHVADRPGPDRTGQPGPGPAPNAPGLRPGLVPWAKAGIIITASTRPGSAYAAMMVTARHGVRMQYDYTSDLAGRRAGVGGVPALAAPDPLGHMITGYDSADGRHWTRVGAARLAGLAGTAQAGPVRHLAAGLHAQLPGLRRVGRRLVPSAASGAFDHVDLRGGTPGGRWTARAWAPPAGPAGERRPASARPAAGSR